MKASERDDLRIVMAVLLIGFLSLIFGGCTNVQHQVRLNKEYIPRENVSIKVAKVVNDTGFEFDMDIEEMLADALEDQLLEEDLLWLGGEDPFLLMESKIIGYKKGSAFKRWMMPGWGATELSIRCELKDDKHNVVGKAAATREVFAGGGYTIGAWKTVFNDVANDVAEDLREQIESLGYVVQPKTMPQKATETPVATFSPAKVDPTEPWTGVWLVDGGRLMGGTWGMKQSDRIVKSTEDSYYEFKGRVRGNQLEGKIKGDYGQYRNFVITLSADGLEFQGKSGSHHLKGKRKTDNLVSTALVSVDPNEPWTGHWKVDGHFSIAGTWILKQNGNRIVSTKNSSMKLDGKVSGNILEGYLEFRELNERIPFHLKMSPDGISFEGKVMRNINLYSNVPIKGTRNE
ncbi:MAG: hypothetical protein JRF29_10145 [Deltaproteobacteria bacterium]|jgi:hypothetical protein|nr:hypothetical protein [Deltaproteobacteria bacterium]